MKVKAKHNKHNLKLKRNQMNKKRIKRRRKRRKKQSKNSQNKKILTRYLKKLDGNKRMNHKTMNKRKNGKIY